MLIDKYATKTNCNYRCNLKTGYDILYIYDMIYVCNLSLVKTQ